MSCFVMVPPCRPSPFRSSRRRAERGEHCRWRRDPVSRVSRARPSARVSAGAVRAPDCAREAEGALLPCVSSGFFRAGANREKGQPRADAASFLLHYINVDFLMSIIFRELFQKKRTRDRFRERRRAALRFEDSKAADAEPLGFE